MRGRPPCLCGQKSMYVIKPQFSLPTGRGSLRPEWRESVKGLTNVMNERMDEYKSKLLLHFQQLVCFYFNELKWRCIE